MRNMLLLIQENKEIETITNANEISFWVWIGIAELIVIIALLILLKRKKKQLEFGDISKDKVKKAKEENVDMNDLMNSIISSKILYKELSRSCHPDRFINSDKQRRAQEIFQEISKNKRDFKKLTELKQIAVSELNIKA